MLTPCQTCCESITSNPFPIFIHYPSIHPSILAIYHDTQPHSSSSRPFSRSKNISMVFFDYLSSQLGSWGDNPRRLPIEEASRGRARRWTASRRWSTTDATDKSSRAPSSTTSLAQQMVLRLDPLIDSTVAVDDDGDDDDGRLPSDLSTSLRTFPCSLWPHPADPDSTSLPSPDYHARILFWRVVCLLIFSSFYPPSSISSYLLSVEDRSKWRTCETTRRRHNCPLSWTQATGLQAAGSSPELLPLPHRSSKHKIPMLPMLSMLLMLLLNDDHQRVERTLLLAYRYQ